MIHVVDGRAASHLPGHRQSGVSTSLGAHLFTVGFILFAARALHPASSSTALSTIAALNASHLIFYAHDSVEPAGGGGGGGNRQSAPIRRAEAKGIDQVTLRVAAPVSAIGRDQQAPALPELVLDARPLSSGHVEQIGLPSGGVPVSTSLGPGSGLGVDDGVGPGIGPGRGPGFGPGVDGGIGDVYRGGGAVSSPRVLTEVKPRYTNRAMLAHLEGTVVLELIVRYNGVPANIRVVRSIDPGGLDEEAVRAASQWRFEPGRLNGKPVDVFASLLIDFHIR